MYLILAKQAAQPAVTAIESAHAANNWSWAPVIQAASVLAGGLLAAVLVHWFTQRRERTQKLREGYAEFAAEAFRYLRYETLVAIPQMSRTVLLYQFMDATQAHQDVLNPRIAALDQEIERLVRESADVTHRLRSAECKLVMLLGRSDSAIGDVNSTYRRLRALQYRTLPETKAIPHSEMDITKQSLGVQERLRHDNEIVRIENMRLDIEEWIVNKAKEIARVEMFGDLRGQLESHPTTTN